MLLAETELLPSNPTEAEAPAPAEATLAHLAPGQGGRVRRVTGQGAIHRRILDMGISRGAHIEVERLAPLGDPIKIKVRGYTLSLRKSEARMIEIEPVSNGSA